MTADQFRATVRASSAPGRMDIVRVLAPVAPLPEEALFRRVLDARRDPDVSAVVLQKCEAA